MANQNVKMGVEGEDQIGGRAPRVNWEAYKVEGCNKLNIRENPNANKTTKILKVVNKGDTLLINPEYLAEEWAQVRLDSKTMGYVMKKYLVR